MVVRLRVRIKSGEHSVTAIAVANSGFEASEPQVVIPLELAGKLGITRGNTLIEEFEVAGGVKTLGYRLEKPALLELDLEDRESPAVEVVVSALPGEREVILSDYVLSKLGIVILDPYRGLWCLRDEVGRKVRASVKG